MHVHVTRVHTASQHAASKATIPKAALHTEVLEYILLSFAEYEYGNDSQLIARPSYGRSL